MKNEIIKLSESVIERKLENIRKICERVEKVQDSYIKCVDDVAELRETKSYDGNFYDFIQERTGMGPTTCKTLLNIKKFEIKYGLEADEVKFLRNLSMRYILKLLKISSDKELEIKIPEILANFENDGDWAGLINTYYDVIKDKEDRKRMQLEAEAVEVEAEAVEAEVEKYTFLSGDRGFFEDMFITFKDFLKNGYFIEVTVKKN